MQLLAPVKRLRARHELVAARRAADAELVASRLPSPRLAWRTNELCDPDHRRRLAESVVEVVRASEGRFLPGSSPLNRAAARAEASSLLRIAAALADTRHRVAPRGVILVERLLAGGVSPLYDERRVDGLRDALAEALAALDGTR